MKKWLFVLVYCTAFFANGQKAKLAEMLQELKTAKPDTNKIKLLYHIGDEYAYNDLKTGRYYYNQALVLSNTLDFTKGIIRYYSSEGELLNMEGKHAACMELLRKGVMLSKERKDKLRLGIMYENMGNTFALMERLDSAMNYYMQAVPIFENFDDSVKLANVYNDLSGVLTRTDKQEKALDYVNKALAISQQNKDGFYLSGLINKAGILWKLKRYDESDKLNAEIIALSKDQHDDTGLADALQSFCSHSLFRKNYSELSKLAIQLLAVTGNLQSNNRNAIAAYWMAAANYYQKKYNDAKHHIQSAVAFAEKDSNIARMKECYVLYAKIIAAGDGNISLADVYADKADSLQQLVLNENIVKTTYDIEAKYETAKKESQIRVQADELQQRKKLNIFLFVLLGLLIISLLFFVLWVRNRQRLFQQEKKFQQQQIQQLEKEKQLAATQSLLKGQEEERSRLAKDLHDGLGGILSSTKYSFNSMKQNFVITEDNARVFEKSMAMLDQSIAELRRVAHNMMPESLMKLSLDDALQDYCQQVSDSGALQISYHSFGIDELQLDNSLKTTVYRIVQELINNAIKHAAATEALVQIIGKNNLMNITIEDNGKGFDTAILDDAGGIGYQNIRSRIAFLKGKMDIQSGVGNGTSVYIEISL